MQSTHLKGAYTLLLVCLCCFSFVPQCYGGDKDKYGKVLIKKMSDTAALRQTVTCIRSISNDLFEAGSYSSGQETTINYHLLQPERNNPDTKYPLVVVFHGSGAIGTDNKSQLGALVKLWAVPATREQYPAYVLAPQFGSRSSNYETDKQRGILVSVPQPGVAAVLALIDSLTNALNIDRRRIYAVGYSMGGSTVINALSLRPDMFAAGVSIAGIPQFSNILSLKKVPVWLLHGNADMENTIAGDAQFYKELKGGKKARFWEFDGAGHDDIFSTLFLQQQIPAWLWEARK